MAAYTMNNRLLGSGTGVLLGCLLCFAGSSSHAQNLVPNPSFELRDSCLEVNTWYTEDTGPLGWFSAGGTGDYFMSCLPYGAFNGVPLSTWAFQYPQDGEAFVGLLTYDQAFGQREYFMVELTKPLVAGQTYFTSMYANPTWGGSNLYPQAWLASNKVGMLFTMQPRPWSSGQPILTGNNFAHVDHPWIITDTVDWTLVSGSFVADSAYRYVMIGNHFNNANTDTLHFAYYPWNARAHTLIDNVCVSPNPGGCDLAQGLGEDLSNGPVLFPNPAQNELVVSLRAGAEAQVLDAMGRLLWQGRIPGDRWVLDVASWARGAYVLRIAHRGQVETHTFVLTDR